MGYAATTYAGAVWPRCPDCKAEIRDARLRSDDVVVMRCRECGWSNVKRPEARDP